jgi:hypothetical protein
MIFPPLRESHDIDGIIAFPRSIVVRPDFVPPPVFATLRRALVASLASCHPPIVLRQHQHSYATRSATSG